jgi:hypothetical protein
MDYLVTSLGAELGPPPCDDPQACQGPVRARSDQNFLAPDPDLEGRSTLCLTLGPGPVGPGSRGPGQGWTWLDLEFL